jgi:hypothetical protein
LFDDMFDRTPPPSRRQPRRQDVVTYVVRVALARTEPPLWRRLEVASDLMLDEVHDITQIAFGWLDYHLHRFGSGRECMSRETEYYLCPFEVEEGEIGIPEEKVRLDEVLADVGDRLHYCYDFGDDWQHVLTLEAVLPRQGGAPRAVCTDGRRPAPAEDCGGPHGYELIVAATDPAHPDHSAAVAEHARVFGADVDPRGRSLTPFKPDAINAELLADMGHDTGSPASDIPEPLADLLTAVRNGFARRDLRRLVYRALPSERPGINAETAARMVRPYAWLLDRVGDEGIALTSAGYLPPDHVHAAWEELGLGDEWLGKGNREAQTLPVLKLRESAQAMGVLRKHRGRLLLTRRARDMRGDDPALWSYLAERIPLRSKHRVEEQAGLIVTVAIAADEADDLSGTLARLLDVIGWVSGDGSELSSPAASRAAFDTMTVLRRMGAVVDTQRWPRVERPTPEGIAFTRTALLTWAR